MGMLRTGLILGAGALLLPSPPPDDSGVTPPPGPSTFAYIAAATETIADLRGFCARNMTACETAGSVASVVEGKAKYSAKLVYEWANAEKPAEAKQDGEQIIAIVDGTGTLTDDDMQIEWKKPKAVKRKG
jgi:hypothetical protein